LKSFLLSWLSKKYAGVDLRTFLAERSEDWLVWEAGPWRPPAARHDTMLSGPGTRLLAAGESLAVALVAKDGGPLVRLGRASENDLVIDDGTLSRQHLVLTRDASGWSVADAGSSNGTKLNGMKIGRTPVGIEPGAQIEAGAVRLTFYDAGSLYMRLRGAA
jgi:pSer/pThr/pTyr-binding forkhead associated (FHA) protein